MNLNTKNSTKLYLFLVTLLFLSSACSAEYIALNASFGLDRSRALKKITDQKVIMQVALTDRAHSVRREAVWKITDQKVLAQIVSETKYENTKKSALRKIFNQKILTQFALNSKKKWVRKMATKGITDQKVLERIALNDNSEAVREAATRKIIDQKVLAQIIFIFKNQEVRKVALERITDQKVLAKIALTHHWWYVREVATRKITDEKVLAQIALNDKNQKVREAATRKVTDEKVYPRTAFLNNKEYSSRRTAMRKKLLNKYGLEHYKHRAVPKEEIDIEMILIEPMLIKHYGKLNLYFNRSTTKKKYSSTGFRYATLFIEHVEVKISDQNSIIIFKENYDGAAAHGVEDFPDLPMASKTNKSDINVDVIAKALFKPLSYEALEQLSKSLNNIVKLNAIEVLKIEQGGP